MTSDNKDTISADKDKNVRERGVSIIQTVRASEAFDKYIEVQSGVKRPKRIRKFIVPKLNFNCKGYTNMIINKFEVRFGGTGLFKLITPNNLVANVRRIGTRTLGLTSGHLLPSVSGNGLGFWDYGFKFNSNKEMGI